MPKELTPETREKASIIILAPETDRPAIPDAQDLTAQLIDLLELKGALSSIVAEDLKYIIKDYLDNNADMPEIPTIINERENYEYL